MRRRKVIATVSTGLAVGVAGCSSEGSDSSDGSEQETQSESSDGSESTDNSDSGSGASFEVVEYNAPENVEIGTGTTIEVTIRNTGDSEGDTSAPLYYRTSGSDWTQVGDSELEYQGVGAGETATAGIETGEFRYIDRYEFALGQSEQTAIIQTVSANIDWGSEYTTPAGYRIRVDSPDLQTTYEYEDFNGEVAEKSPESRGQWAFVNVWVKNETGQTAFSPLASEFGLLYGSSQSDGETILIDDPINKGSPFDGGELQPGVERSGWIVFELPGDVSTDDLTMAWSQTTASGEISVNWQ